ncbi:hypothetical protein [Melittangium boletus]|uniref:Uncharacterized protein n=1 Tax=Melittangium boletus DSM 14713 TaxID=1294270 RepID=A0A250IMK5_9BACT|nr:hypothetical protein [Melittangium boletus]ATB32421.1 hypothetical protein MEBOL_005899 [Melittangium boletus DSM 14713]
MSLLPESASFEELVHDYFLALRGSGLMLSALDTELVTAWAALGVPFEVVARGIARSAEKALWDARPGEPVLRSLRACRRQVEAEIKRYRERAAGAGEGVRRPARRTFEELRHAQWTAALTQLAETEPALAPRIQGLLAMLAREVPQDFERMQAQETLVSLVLLRALPFPERRALWRTASGADSDAGFMSAHARRLSRRFRLLMAVRRRLGLGDA